MENSLQRRRIVEVGPFSATPHEPLRRTFLAIRVSTSQNMVAPIIEDDAVSHRMRAQTSDDEALRRKLRGALGTLRASMTMLRTFGEHLGLVQRLQDCQFARRAATSAQSDPRSDLRSDFEPQLVVPFVTSPPMANQ